MIQKSIDSLNSRKANNKSCLVCRDLLINIQQFLDMLGYASRISESSWLTVDDIAKELKISKSIVYRLIRNGELEAIDIVDSNGEIAQRGHYRINRKSLGKYLDSKKVKPLSKASVPRPHTNRFPKVKNHLGI